MRGGGGGENGTNIFGGSGSKSIAVGTGVGDAGELAGVGS